jgi:hypothetical protein
VSKKPIWYLEGPFYRYAGDVKAAAAKAGVRIVDSRFAPENRPNAAPEKDLPKVSLLPEYAPAKKETAAERKAREARELADAQAAAKALTGSQNPPQE